MVAFILGVQIKVLILSSCLTLARFIGIGDMGGSSIFREDEKPHSRLLLLA